MLDVLTVHLRFSNETQTARDVFHSTTHFMEKNENTTSANVVFSDDYLSLDMEMQRMFRRVMDSATQSVPCPNPAAQLGRA